MIRSLSLHLKMLSGWVVVPAAQVSARTEPSGSTLAP